MSDRPLVVASVVAIWLCCCAMTGVAHEPPKIVVLYDRGDTNKFFIRVNDKKLWGTAARVDANVELARFSDRPPWMGVELRGVVLEGEGMHGKFGSITIYRQSGQMRFSGADGGPVTVRIKSDQGFTVLRGLRRVSYDLLDR